MKQSNPSVTIQSTNIEHISNILIKLAKKDQAIREIYETNKSTETVEKMLRIDRSNREMFKRLFKDTGLITSDYGEKAQTAAFLIVQHMPVSEIEFMKQYLSLMKKNMQGYNSNQFAMLVDRIRTREGKGQLYGTQFIPVEGKENTYKMNNLYKPEKVDQRREKLGLEPLKDYIKNLEKERGVSLVW